MPKISTRGEAIKESPIRSLAPYSRAAAKSGKKIHFLNIGQPDIETPSQALASLHNFKNKIIAYGPSEGYLSLREKVSNYYTRFNIKVASDQIMVTTGASEAILFALFSCFNAGDEIIIPEPFYANYLGFSQMAGITIRPVSTYLKDQFQLPSIEDFEKIIGPKTKAIFLCNPGNPTGQLYEEAALNEIAHLVKKHDLFLIVDEVYREFCYESSFYSVLNFPAIENHVIVLDSISKVFSSCGARIGYLVSRNKEVLYAVNKLSQLRLCPPAIGQVIAEACYLDNEDYIAKVKAEYDLRREKLFARLSNIEGIECYKPNAAFYNIASLPIDNAQKFCKWLLTDFSYNNQTLMLAPADGFYFNSVLGEKQVRIAFILDCDNLDLAMDCLSIGLKAYREIVRLG